MELDKCTNVVSSPLCAEMLLALLALGSSEPAHSELLEALNIPDNESLFAYYKYGCSRIGLHSSPANMDAAAFASAVAEFSTKFLNELDKCTNVVSSPLSAEMLLALLALGSSEPAHSELLEALNIPDNESIRSSFGALTAKLKSIKGVTLNVANKIYIKDDGCALDPELKNDAEKIFDAEFEKINFKDPAHAALIINEWVEKKTNDRIKDLFSPDSFDVFTCLVLVNAIYFKGLWKTKFNVKDTLEQKFYIDDKQSVNVPMMFKADSFNYKESHKLHAQLLEMSYEGEEMSLVIVLPKKIDGLAGVMQQLADGYDLMGELERMSRRPVSVHLPKFTIETEIDLKTLLPQLGIEAIFRETGSGLTKILDNGEPLFVSTAVQKAYIEVNEDGTEASAGSGAGMSVMSIPLHPANFRADHPFLYLLVDADRTILFIGAYRGK